MGGRCPARLTAGRLLARWLAGACRSLVGWLGCLVPARLHHWRRDSSPAPSSSRRLLRNGACESCWAAAGPCALQAQGKHDEFVWLDGQCDYKYLIHTAGFSYSGGGFFEAGARVKACGLGAGSARLCLRCRRLLPRAPIREDPSLAPCPLHPVLRQASSTSWPAARSSSSSAPTLRSSSSPRCRRALASPHLWPDQRHGDVTSGAVLSQPRRRRRAQPAQRSSPAHGPAHSRPATVPAADLPRRTTCTSSSCLPTRRAWMWSGSSSTRVRAGGL